MGPGRAGRTGWRRVVLGMTTVAAAVAALGLVPAGAAQAASTTLSVNGATVTLSSLVAEPGGWLHADYSFTNPTSAPINNVGVYLMATPDTATPPWHFVSCTAPVNGFCGVNTDPYAVGISADYVLPGETRTGQVVFAVNADAPGSFQLRLAVEWPSGAPTQYSDPVTVLVGAADLAVGLRASTGGLLSGSVSYAVTVGNTGPDPLRSATVTTALPAGLAGLTGGACTYQPASRTETCSVGALPVGASTSVSFRAVVGLLDVGRFTATARRTASDPTDPNAANDAASASCQAITALLVSC